MVSMESPEQELDRRNNDQRLVDMLHGIDLKTTRIETKMELIEGNYVSRAEFLPIQRLVYGVVSVILMSFVGGLLTLVFMKGA